MKLIFLDIDGVMNCEDHPYPSDPEVHFGLEMSPRAIRTLRNILVENNAWIIVSSSWRIGRTVEELRNIFRHYNNVIADRIIGKTDELGRRDLEIKAFLETITKMVLITGYVVIDDDDFDLGLVKENLVKCDRKTGLTEKYTWKIRRILNKRARS
jgi:hypothetical protein